jgi:hypothetical protein
MVEKDLSMRSSLRKMPLELQKYFALVSTNRQIAIALTTKELQT